MQREFVESFFDCVSGWNIRIFADIMYRPLNVPPADVAFLPVQFRSQLIKINRHLELTSPDEIAVVLLDGDGRQYNNIAARYSNWVYRSRMGQSLSRIADTPYLVDSKITQGIQIADMAAYVIRTYQENKLFNGVPTGSHYYSAIARYYRILKRQVGGLGISQWNEMARLQHYARALALWASGGKVASERRGISKTRTMRGS